VRQKHLGSLEKEGLSPDAEKRGSEATDASKSDGRRPARRPSMRHYTNVATPH